ncbi:MAG: carbamoyl-phosphate synthase large subunit, partial [Deltaproteobacteria bacterium]|nr:carbamoyl-phosphate synthase large subunit [Deltaproteobacteria bacterium]
IGLEVPRSGFAHTQEEAHAVLKTMGLPAVIRPSFTLGGTGGGIAFNMEEFRELSSQGIELSMIHEIMIEESVVGWKEYELEVMRDRKDNVVIICSIENFDPMGVHTGDSITVAPAQTLSDKEYQRMRDAAIAIIREIGVETGGSNIQFALNPADGRMVIIEMNPRVSRSSALASKATGFPIAKVAAKLAVGYTLDEIPNDITRETLASFEPALDYCVVKIPRWNFEKFRGADPVLTTSMKSVGEAMAIGRTFKEALQKAIRSLEIGRFGFGMDGKGEAPAEAVREKLALPTAERIFYLHTALKAGISPEEISDITRIDRWFLENLKQICDLEKVISEFRAPGGGAAEIPGDILRRAKEYGFSDVQLGHLLGADEMILRKRRQELGITPTYKLVDTCAAEFEAYTPYYYSTYETEDEIRPSRKKKVMILGGGPNRIGQGIEFDYCCVHASLALREEGYETIMVNSNPETVSTDYDTSDRLYFEPLTREDVLNIVEKEKPEGIIVQFGGQTPLNLAVPLEKAGVRILGTSPDSIDRAEDRARFKVLIQKLGLFQPQNGTATSFAEARRAAKEVGYPVVVRPSYVLGGRAMEIVYEEEALERYMCDAVKASLEHPILIDKFLEEAIEVDVDAISDGERVVIGGIMEHIEEAGIHSGDSACVLPPYTLSDGLLEVIRENTYALARELGVKGLMNIQYAIRNDVVYILEVNPRASRTVPFVSKATGVPLAKLAAKVMVGRTLEELGFTKEVEVGHVAVKESVFPFNRFPGVDAVLGPEMKSTGEVMGIDHAFGIAFAKAELAAGQLLPTQGKVFISVKNRDKRGIIFLAKKLSDFGFQILATRGTAKALLQNGIPVQIVNKVHEGRPNVVDLIKNREVDLIINTPTGHGPKRDQLSIRAVAVAHNVPLITTISGAAASINGIEALRREEMQVRSLQEYHQKSDG